jgi:phosphatidylserine decarboxylase
MSRAYARAWGVDIEEAAAPHGGYKSFDDFFTRQLRPGARSIADASLVSPCDGYLTSVGPIDDAARLFAKGKPYDVGELLGQPSLSREYLGGHFAVIYLSPRDYHRVHCPVDGRILSIRATPGDRYPVNAFGERNLPRLLVRNRRVTVVIERDDQRKVALVMVGALVVGKITISVLGKNDVPAGLHEVSHSLRVKRGDELGAFHLGSTVVLMVQPGIVLDATEGQVRYGQSLARGVA